MRMLIRGGASYRTAFIGILVAAVTAAPASGQQTSYITPSVSMTQSYDNNLLFGFGERQADFITRVTPGIEAQSESRLMTVAGEYFLDADRFNNHPELTAVDNQRATARIRYAPAPRYQFATEAAFIRTVLPGELNVDSGLVLTRAPAVRFNLHPSATRDFNRNTSATVNYQLTDDRLTGGLHIRTHGAALRIEHHQSQRVVTTVDYGVQRFDFGPATATMSHVLTFGWTREMAQGTRLMLRAGPRVTAGTLSPELSAGIETRLKSADLSLAYAQTRTTLIGVVGTADTQSVTASALYRRWRRLQARVSPAIYRVVQNRFEGLAYHVGFQTTTPVGRAMSFVTMYDFSLQHGSLYTALSGYRPLSRQVVSVGFVHGATMDHH
jgi:hypothetical protein